jgi:lipopolysaccharide transport system ATP-binding protein
MQAEVLIKVEGLSKRFCKDLKTSLWYGTKDLFSGIFGNIQQDSLRDKEFWAVKDINFELRRGECLGLIGHNGAGKSTLLKILNGLINPDAGKVTMRGRVGALIELGAGFNPILTGRENIYNNGAVLGFSRMEIDAKVEKIIDFSEIRDFIDMPVQNYSSGMRVRLGFAVAAQMEPDILIIDEVLAVGDVGFRFKCLNAIGMLMKNSAVIFVSHSMPQVFRICTEILVMNKGMSVFHGNNVGKGVELYFNMFPDGVPQVFGTGEARVSNFEIASNNLNISSTEYLKVEHGGVLDIKMTVELDSSIDSAMLQIVIWNQDMLPIIDILDSNLSPFELFNTKSTHELYLTLPHLDLNTGKYSISLIINSKNFDINYCRADNLGKFLMTSEVASGCSILTPVQWNIL